MKQIIQTNPPVIIDAAHYERLQGIASSFHDPNGTGDRLLEEISRAEIRQTEEVPPNVVNIGSKVTYRDEATGKTQTVFLVWPFQADIDQKKISILTPIGVALIGLAEDAGIDWETYGGQKRRLTILKVER